MRRSPASAAIRASSGTVCSIWYGWVRKCWPAETSSRPSSRARATCSQQSRTISAADSAGGCWAERKMPNRGVIRALQVAIGQTFVLERIPRGR